MNESTTNVTGDATKNAGAETPARRGWRRLDLALPISIVAGTVALLVSLLGGREAASRHERVQAVSEEWSIRLERCSQLMFWSMELSRPAGSVFASHDPAAERVALDQASQTFDQYLRGMSQELAAEQVEDERLREWYASATGRRTFNELLRTLAEADAASHQVVADARGVLDLAAAGDAGEAQASLSGLQGNSTRLVTLLEESRARMRELQSLVLYLGTERAQRFILIHVMTEALLIALLGAMAVWAAHLLGNVRRTTERQESALLQAGSSPHGAADRRSA